LEGPELLKRLSAPAMPRERAWAAGCAATWGGSRAAAGGGAGATADGADSTAGVVAVTGGGASAAGEGAMLIRTQPASARTIMKDAITATAQGFIAP